MSKLDKIANKLNKKYAQTAPVAPVVPAAPDANYVGFMDAYQKLLVNSVSGLGGQEVSKILEMVMPYKSNAAKTSTENAQVIVASLSKQFNEMQANLNTLKQLASAILASS